MTNKKAIKILKNIEFFLKSHTIESCEEEHTAIDLAIKALEQQLKCGCNTCEYYPMKDQRPQGEWITTRTLEHDGNPYCTNCGEETIIRYRFCPNCGADMKGTEK